MAKYKDKWKTTFPASIGNQTRPEDGVDNTQEYNTDGLPQYMANDPVRYDLQNAVNSQLVSNDERLNEKIKRTSDDLAAHNKDPKAHVTGIAGNAATASKLITPRTISLTGKAAGSTTFDGSSNASINVTSVNADTASKLSTARKINITGNATGSAAFDGSGDVSISTTVNESKHAVNADVAKTLETTDANGVKSNGQFFWVGKDGQPMWLWGSNTKPSETYVYNPANFHVAAADIATAANTATKVNATAPNGGATDLVFGIMANDDSARIRVGGSSDNGWLEIATSDNGNEPIYARQYSGSFLQDGAKSVTNEAVLLDGSGNTKFPHNVTAANFVGHLTGNADTATKASVADVVQKAIQPRGVYGNNSYIFYGTLTIPQNGDFFKLEVLGGYGHNSNIEQSREGTLYFRTGNNAPAHYTAYSEYHRNGAVGFKFFVVKDSGTKYRIYGGPTIFTGTMQVIPYIGQNSSFDLALNNVSALPNGAVEVEQQQLIYASTVNNYAPTKTGGGASGTWGINISGNADTVDGYHASDLLSKIYPVGSIYMSMSATNPATLFGVGTWTRISQGRMLLGADDSTYKAGATGGEATHTLTAAEMPAHSHGISTSGDHSHYFYGSDHDNGQFTEGDGLDTEANLHYTKNERFTTSSAGAHTHTISNSGGGAAHNNMSPYLVCYIWQRTA